MPAGEAANTFPYSVHIQKLTEHIKFRNSKYFKLFKRHELRLVRIFILENSPQKFSAKKT